MSRLVARGCFAAFVLSCLTHGRALAAQTADPLPSWCDGNAKRTIMSFVRNVTDESRKTYVAPAERIAVFDNDGTLWPEQPVYTQLRFALDRVKSLAPQHPEWTNKEPFKSALAGDLDGVAAGGTKGLLELITATHAGNTTEEFEQIVKDWLASAKHPKFKKLYTELTYQPMRELLTYLRANGFKTYIVSGGGVEFMRPWTNDVYGIPPEQVIGSTIKTEYQLRDGRPVLARLPEMDFIDDKEGKPVGIHQFIGRRPIFAAGNSDGDFQMLQWTTDAPGPRLGILVHHTDAAREFQYDRDSHVGRLDKALDQAAQFDWTVVDMKQDWRQVFSSDN